MLEILLILTLLGFVWFWWDSVHSREIASHAGKQLCGRFQVQLLDDSINLDRLHFKRLPPPASFPFWQIERCYHFDFTTDGEIRHQGEVYLRNQHVVGIHLPGFYEKVLQSNPS